jgi:hypothetical protein
MKTGHQLTKLSLIAITMGFATIRLVGQQQSTEPAHPSVVLVELFTSEGCSDCPPADDLLKLVHLHKSSAGQLIVGISEHVTYWNRLGWTDPFSSEQYTARQNDYGTHFALDSVYTPQMVVNGREQFVGSDRRALQAALDAEAQRKQIALHIDTAQVAGNHVVFKYSATDLPAKGSFDLIAVLVDDMDRSSVKRGENSGRDLAHVSVARAMVNLGKLQPAQQMSASLPLPPSFAAGAGQHLVLFAQQAGTGAVIGADATPL